MRRKKEAVLSFESSDDGLPKVVRDYRARYRAISQVLDDNPEILSAVHKDLLKLSQGDSKGREGDYTSENILRALVVQHIEGLPFREAVIRIGGDAVPAGLPADAEEGRDGLHLPGQVLPGHPARRPGGGSTNCLASMELRRKRSAPNVIRTDTTVVESNIHYPTDASLLWDTWRVASRLLKRAREIAPESVPAPLPRPQDQAAVPVHHALHAQQVGVSPAEGESGLPHADRADGLDRGDCRGILHLGDRAGQRRRWRRWPWN